MTLRRGLQRERRRVNRKGRRSVSFDGRPISAIGPPVGNSESTPRLTSRQQEEQHSRQPKTPTGGSVRDAGKEERSCARGPAPPRLTLSSARDSSSASAAYRATRLAAGGGPWIIAFLPDIWVSAECRGNPSRLLLRVRWPFQAADRGR